MVLGKRLYLITIICTAGGILFYGFYDEKIHIDYSVRSQTTIDWNKTKRSITYFYIKNDTPFTLTEVSYLSHLDAPSLKNIINIWLSHIPEYHSQLPQVLCHSLEIKNTIYYCSFTHNPFLSTTSMHEKHNFFEGLLQTLFTLDTSLKGIIFLINHQLFEDEDYDFTLPWNNSFYK